VSQQEAWVKQILATLFGLAALATTPTMQAGDQVDMELMTYPEIAAAMQHGKTTALVYNGGTEQRGPHAVLGGHTLIARRTSVEIARQLGNALVAPVLPFSIAGDHLNPKWPGTVTLPGPVFAAVNAAVVDSMVVNGFKNIVLMGDHGGGQDQLKDVATRLDAKYAPRGVHVYFCSDLYAKTRADEDAYINAQGLPPTTHGGVSDTSVLMYLGGDAYVRKDKLVAGDPVLPRGERPNPSGPRVNNGVHGDPRPSTPELGKIFSDMKVKNAVTQIRAMTSRK
jgi:creatinine amidohydrolase/Fe(II)-dependent formamide hydrolase-like protein